MDSVNAAKAGWLLAVSALRGPFLSSIRATPSSFLVEVHAEAEWQENPAEVRGHANGHPRGPYFKVD